MHLPNALLVVTSYNEGNRSVALSGRDGLPRFPGLKPWAVLLDHFHGQELAPTRLESSEVVINPNPNCGIALN